MSQRAPLLITLALVIITVGSTTRIFVQGVTSPRFYIGMVVGNSILAVLLLVISEEPGKRPPEGAAYVKETA